jgi:NADPH:quinone reductase-like Zn-dependent oxidoreductase
MRAVYAASLSAEDPLSGLVVGELPLPDDRGPSGFVRVKLTTSALNHHDIFSLKGVGLAADKLPMVLGGDGAGVDDDGNEVIVHSVVSTPDWRGDETLDPKRSLLSERYHGTMADYVWVPARNLVPKPAELSFAEAAALPTSWLTAYRMLFSVSQVQPGSTILVQGAGGGVATALISLGKAAGFRVWATSRSEEKKAKALVLGASECFATGERLPERVDVVFDTVGEATWSHSLKSLNPGGTIITCGATSGAAPSADLGRVFFMQLRIIGSTMGTREELVRLSQFLANTGVRPEIDSVYPLEKAKDGFQKMLEGDIFGKVIFQH